MDVSKYENAYKYHKEMHLHYFQEFKRIKAPVAFPIANEVLINLSQRINDIYLGLLAMGKIDNLYSALILYRPLLEHFYRGQYIIHKTAYSKNDQTAEQYQKHLFLHEVLNEKKSEMAMENLISGHTEKPDFIKYIIAKMPELAGFDQDNIREIDAGEKQFRIKEIVKYLFSEYTKNESLKASNHVVAQAIPEYSFACTFTHGGAYAANLMDKFIQNNHINDQFNRILHIGLACTCSLTDNIFATYQVDSSFKKIVLELQKAREI